MVWLLVGVGGGGGDQLIKALLSVLVPDKVGMRVCMCVCARPCVCVCLLIQCFHRPLRSSIEDPQNLPTPVRGGYKQGEGKAVEEVEEERNSGKVKWGRWWRESAGS